MAQKFLCPVDGTDHATHAVELAADMAQRFGGTLLVCLVNVAMGGGRGPLVHYWNDLDAQAILDKAVAVAEGRGVKPEGTAVVLDRDAAIGIVRYAEMNGVDHIVVGTGDKRGLSRLVLGSVAADVVGKAHCSVTVAR